MFTVRGHFHNMPRKMLMMMMTTMVMVMMVMIMMIMVMIVMMMISIFLFRGCCNDGDFFQLVQGGEL